jgi:hypothetical protein
MSSRQPYGKFLECLPVPVEPEEFMAVFHMYGDESGKGHQSDYTSFCGYVAHISVWQGFGELWHRLQMKWQVPAIHMGRIMSPDKKDDAWKRVKADWGVTWERKRDLMLAEFSLLIRNSPIVSIGAIVDSAHFRKAGGGHDRIRGEESNGRPDD